MKRIIGDILSLILGNNDEKYEPSKIEYTIFGLILLLTLLLIFGLNV